MTKEETITAIMTYAHNGELTNAELKHLIESLSDYGGLKSLTVYAREKGISPAAASKHKCDKVVINDKYFIIDND